MKKVIIMVLLPTYMYTQSIEDAYLDLARAWQSAGNTVEAIATYRTLLNHNPAHNQALFELGVQLYQYGDNIGSINYFERFLHSNPTHGYAHLYIGMAYAINNNIDKALEHYQETYFHNPDIIKLYSVWGIAYEKKELMSDALTCYQRGLLRDPHNVELLTLYTKLLKKSGHYEQALVCYEKLLQQQPSSSLLLEKATIYVKLDRFNDALTIYESFLQTTPDNQNLLATAAALYSKIGSYAKACACYEQLLIQYPTSSKIHFELAKLYLAQGDQDKGFLHLHQSNSSTYTKKILNNYDDVHGSTILLGGEWLHEDIILYVSLAKLLKDHGAFIIVQTPQALKELLQRCPFVDRVITLEQKESCYFDWYIPFSSLPYITRTLLPRDIPTTGYLMADPQRVSFWHTTITNKYHHKKKIGIYGKHLTTETMQQLMKLLAQDASLYLLHPGNNYHIVAQLSVHNPILCFGGGFEESADNIEELAALIHNLDIIITCDGTVAHLAGAMGKKTFVFVEQNTLWRWQEAQGICLWYPTVHILHQDGDWKERLDF